MGRCQVGKTEFPRPTIAARMWQKVQGCRGDTHFLHLLHPSARFAPFCQVCSLLPGLHPSARFAPFCGGRHQERRPGPRVSGGYPLLATVGTAGAVGAVGTARTAAPVGGEARATKLGCPCLWSSSRPRLLISEI